MCLAVPGKIVELTDKEQCLVKVDLSGAKQVINVRSIIDTMHPYDSCVGEWVLIHFGFATSRVDEEEALKIIEVLEEMGTMMEQQIQKTSDL